MKRYELWLGSLLVVTGFLGACTNVAEDEFRNNQYPMELMAEKSAMTFTRSIGEKTEWDGGETVSLYDGFSQKLYEVSQSGEMSAKNNDPLYWYTTTEEETLFAWYPSSETLLTEWTVATDQTNEESYKNSDFLYAYEKMKFRSERKLKFHHGTVKLIINVKGDGDTVSEEDLKDMVFTVSAYDLYPDHNFAREEQIVYTSLDELYHNSDIISLHCPLTEATKYLINDYSISKMKDGVMIINTGRGQLIHTNALIEGLKNKKIGSAGLDVYEEESEYFYEDQSDRIIDDDVLARLLSFNNVIVTSHQAFFTHEAMENIAATTLQNIKDFINHKPLLNEVKK